LAVQGGGETAGDGRGQSGKKPHLEPWHPRPVRIVDAGRQKALEVTVEVPIEDMAEPGDGEETGIRPGSKRTAGRSIWPSIYPRLVDWIRAHRSTMIFVDSRRLAERLASAGENRFAVVEDAARFRDALGLALPPGLPAAFLEPVADPLGDLVSRKG